MTRAVLVLVAFLALVGTARADTLRVGSVTLESCGASYCGSLERPLDPARPTGRRIDIAFRWYPAPETPTGPPIVAVEGGPGYPSTGSRVEYRGIFGPLVRQRGMLLVDNRGTGGSALIDCKGVQGFAGRTSGSAFARRAGRCGESLERKYGRGGSALFSTAYAVDDLAAVLRALRIRRIDLYGDSYGTFFVQDFVARHPSVLRKVVLDSSYPRSGTDPWYASSGEAFRFALEKVAPGSLGRLGELLARVRTAPIAGATKDSDGSAITARVDARALADLVQATASDPVALRELDASITAALAGDDVPLLRLAGQAGTWNFSPGDAEYFSRGAYLAVNCVDLPQLFDLGASPAVRRTQLAAAVAPSFAPFTGAEWLTISGFSQPYDVCLDWPKPRKRPPRLPDVTLPASVPVLITGGDLDSLTPLLDAPAIAARIGENVTVVPLPNTVHVTSQGGDFLVHGMRCARTVIRSFLRGRTDDACAATIPALGVPDFTPEPATVVSGSDPGEAARRAAAIGVQAFADAVFRRHYSGVDRGPGLRGGTFTARGDTFTLRDVRFTADVAVNGTGRWDASTGGARVELTVGTVKLTAVWSQAAPLAAIDLGGTLLSTPAP
jgi:pimeloyl-ACP methyl ester carboxylesterase